MFAAVDCTSTENVGICKTHDVQGFPTIRYFNFFRHSEPYFGGRSVSLYFVIPEYMKNHLNIICMITVSELVSLLKRNIDGFIYFGFHFLILQLCYNILLTKHKLDGFKFAFLVISISYLLFRFFRNFCEKTQENRFNVSHFSNIQIFILCWKRVLENRTSLYNNII